MDRFATVIQEQAADIATLARIQLDDRKTPKGSVKGLGREEEDLVLLARACDQHAVAICPQVLGRPLYTALKEAAIGAGGALRAVGWSLPMRNRLAHGLAGGYWGGRNVGVCEKWSLTAADFPGATTQELDDHLVPQDDTLEARPRNPATWDDWLRRARRGINVWSLVYGEEWRRPLTACLEGLERLHEEHPTVFPQYVIQDPMGGAALALLGGVEGDPEDPKARSGKRQPAPQRPRPLRADPWSGRNCMAKAPRDVQLGCKHRLVPQQYPPTYRPQAPTHAVGVDLEEPEAQPAAGRGRQARHDEAARRSDLPRGQEPGPARDPPGYGARPPRPVREALVLGCWHPHGMPTRSQRLPHVSPAAGSQAHRPSLVRAIADYTTRRTPRWQEDRTQRGRRAHRSAQERR